MNLNYTAFFLISFLPLLIAGLWYHPSSPILKWSKEPECRVFQDLSFFKVLLLFVLSFLLVFGYMNLVIHQMGFYELFFTDIMQGNEDSKKIVKDFLEKYGQKHRHLGHGIFHGIINAFAFALPFIGFHAILGKKKIKYFTLHFSYWLITSIIIGGLISEFV